MSASRATFRDKLGYGLFQTLRFVLKLCHIKLVALFGMGIGHLAWLLIASRRRIVERNLRITIDAKLTRKELRPLIRRNIVLTCMNFACALKVGVMTSRELEAAVSIEDHDFFENSGLNGKTGISCIPHAGNWEILARIRPLFPKVARFGSMYRRMSNPLLEELIYRSRTNYGCEMFSKEAGLRQVIKLAKEGGLLGVLCDQFTQEGMHLPYFGKVTGTTNLPALLYKMCRGGTLIGVFTRNTSLGKWDVVMGRTVEPVNDPRNPIAANTVAINHLLERNQKENILDGFWMHHRWKCTDNFAPVQDKGVAEIAAEHTLLPFRAIVALPEAFEEALFCLPALHGIKQSRFDMQITLVCPSEQIDFWKRYPQIASHVLSSDDKQQKLSAQFAQNDVYKDGPFDLLFMWSENARTFKQILSQAPLYISGFEENPLSKRFRARFTEKCYAAPRPRAEDYTEMLQRRHYLSVHRDIDWSCPLPNCTAENTALYLAPFSSLGEADSWPLEHWQSICARYPQSQILALEADKHRAQSMAKDLGIHAHVCKPHKLLDLLGKKSCVLAVDGLIAQLAALSGAQTHIIMASRLRTRYEALGAQVQSYHRHLSCHPCYQAKCDYTTHCTSEIKPEQIKLRLLT